MKWIGVLAIAAMTAGCTTLPIVDAPSANQNSRIDHLVLHFTSEDFAESLRLLTQRTNNPVSVHYLVPEPGDETYPQRRLRIYRLVTEQRRAWHAGKSYWAGAETLNDTSIGIEIVNRSACTNTQPEGLPATPDAQDCNFLAFPGEQIALVTRLARDILARNPDIDPVDVIGHGDVAPDRRVDPGPLFPWRLLYEQGIGAWYDDATVARFRVQFTIELPELILLQRALRAYGYHVEDTGVNDVQTRFAVRAFQMHFRPAAFSGKVDAETAAILFALLEKYRAPALQELLQMHTDFSE